MRARMESMDNKKKKKKSYKTIAKMECMDQNIRNLFSDSFTNGNFTPFGVK